MNSVVQPKQTASVFVVALLFFGFAIAQSAHAVPPEPGRPPNHPVFPVNVNEVVPVPCAGETVHLSGELHLHFKTINGVAHPECQMDRIDPNQPLCTAVLEAKGPGDSSGRLYVAHDKPSSSNVDIQTKMRGGAKTATGKWFLEFKVIGMPNDPPQGDVCPGCVFRFTLKYTVFFESRNGKVFEADARPEVLCP